MTHARKPSAFIFSLTTFCHIKGADIVPYIALIKFSHETLLLPNVLVRELDVDLFLDEAIQVLTSNTQSLLEVAPTVFRDEVSERTNLLAISGGVAAKISSRSPLEANSCATSLDFTTPRFEVHPSHTKNLPSRLSFLSSNVSVHVHVPERTQLTLAGFYDFLLAEFPSIHIVNVHTFRLFCIVQIVNHVHHIRGRMLLCPDLFSNVIHFANHLAHIVLRKHRHPSPDGALESVPQNTTVRALTVSRSHAAYRDISSHAVVPKTDRFSSQHEHAYSKHASDRQVVGSDLAQAHTLMRSTSYVASSLPVSSEAGDEEMRDSRNVSECDAAQIPVLEGARDVNRSKQPTESERRRHELSHLPHVPWCTICCRARTKDDAHDVVIHEGSVDSLPKIVCDYAEIKMKGDTTPMKVLLVVDSSTGYLGPTDVGLKGGGSGFAAKWWLSGWNPLVMHE